MPAARAFRGLFENVVRDCWIRAGNAVEKVIERDFRAGCVAVLAGINQPFNLQYSRSVHKNDVLQLGSGIEEVASHCGMSFLVGRLFVNPPKLIKPALMQQ